MMNINNYEYSGSIILFERGLSFEKYNYIFSYKYYLNLQKQKIHFSYEKKIINFFEKLFIENNNKVNIVIDYIDSSIFHEIENNSMFKKSKLREIKLFFSNLDGGKLFFNEKIKVYSKNILKDLIELISRDYITIYFIFENMDLILKSREEYEYEIYNLNSKNQVKFLEICEQQKIFFKKNYEI